VNNRNSGESALGGFLLFFLSSDGKINSGGRKEVMVLWGKNDAL
jgi:hypothetical protein